MLALLLCLSIDSPTHPCWSRFRDVVGDTLESRVLFREIMSDKARAALMDEAASLAWFANKVEVKAARRVSNVRGKTSAADIALVLFLGTYRRIEPEDIFERQRAERDIANSRTQLREVFDSGGAAFRKLLVAWVNCRNDLDARSVVGTVLAYGIREVVHKYRAILVENKAPPPALWWAAAVLLNMGEECDVRLLKLFRDRDDFQFGGANNVPARVCDAAAAAALKLSGQKPELFGFQMDQSDGPTPANPGRVIYTLAIGFANQKARDDAAKKAWAWLDDQRTAKFK